MADGNDSKKKKIALIVFVGVIMAVFALGELLG